MITLQASEMQSIEGGGKLKVLAWGLKALAKGAAVAFGFVIGEDIVNGD